MKLVPLGDKVVLKQLEAEETTKSGIVLPGQAKEKPQQAEVIAVGPGGVVDGKEVQRCWHLGVENVKHHRFEHQDKGDKHFIAPGFIQLECLTKEDDGDDDGENNQHQIGDFYVVHQPCAYEDHHHAAK